MAGKLLRGFSIVESVAKGTEPVTNMGVQVINTVPSERTCSEALFKKAYLLRGLRGLALLLERL